MVKSREPADKLARYRAKRDFTITAEPSGTAPPPEDGRRFVVQRHRATRLHYDLRLEVDGVLVSWAVPKGPTLDPKVRRLAVHVEDHPLDYYDFEGVIAAGEYGGGDAIVWDGPACPPTPRTPLPRSRPATSTSGAGREACRTLRARPAAGKDDWLLIHKDDDYAVPGWDPEDHPRSVKSGQTNDEVLAESSRSWRLIRWSWRPNQPPEAGWRGARRPGRARGPRPRRRRGGRSWRRGPRRAGRRGPGRCGPGG